METQYSIESWQALKSEVPIFYEELVLVEQENSSQTRISTMSKIGGYGTISCFDGGEQVLVCNVTFRLTGGAKIKGVEATVTTKSSAGLQWGEETISEWFTGTLYSKFETQIEEPLYATGKYYATVTGAVASLDKIYNILPVKSATTTIN